MEIQKTEAQTGKKIDKNGEDLSQQLGDIIGK